MAGTSAPPFQCAIMTPPDGMVFEERTPLAVTGFAFLPLAGPAPVPPLPHLRPAKDIVISQSIGGRLIDRIGTATASDIYNPFSGMVHAARKAPAMNDGQAATIRIALDATMILLDGAEQSLADHHQIAVRAAGSGGTPAAARPSEARGALVGSIDPPQGSGGVIEGFDYNIAGEAKKTRDDQFLFIYVIDQSTGVILDSFVAPNWSRSTSKFRAKRTAPATGGASSRPCRVIAQRIRMRTGEIEGALVRDFSVAAPIIPAARAASGAAPRKASARLLLPPRGHERD